MYTRASASDYDDWETEGWSFNDILPLARKMETHHLTEGQNPKVHGKDGPLHVSYGGHQSELGKQFIKATEESNYEIPYTDDLQDFKTGHGITPWAKVSNRHSSPLYTLHNHPHPLRALADPLGARFAVDQPQDRPPLRHRPRLHPSRGRDPN